MRTGIIYIITNSVTDHVYIGGTTTALKARWYNHKSDSRKYDYPLYLLMRKHGIENFRIEALEENVPLKDLAQRETSYLRDYYERSADLMLNLKLTASPHEYSNHKAASLSIAHSGSKRNEKTREKMRESQSRIPRKRIWHLQSNAPKPVRCIELDLVFRSRNAAEKEFGLAVGSIAKAIQREGTSGGFRWEEVA